MANLGEKYALGGVVTGAPAMEGTVLAALRWRVRRWLSSDLSVEAEAGAFWATQEVSGDPMEYGRFAVQHPRSGIDCFAVGHIIPSGGVPVGGVRVLRSRRYPARTFGRSECGSVPALIGTGALGVTMAVLFAIFVGQAGY